MQFVHFSKGRKTADWSWWTVWISCESEVFDYRNRVVLVAGPARKGWFFLRPSDACFALSVYVVVCVNCEDAFVGPTLLTLI